MVELLVGELVVVSLETRESERWDDRVVLALRETRDDCDSVTLATCDDDFLDDGDTDAVVDDDFELDVDFVEDCDADVVFV